MTLRFILTAAIVIILSLIGSYFLIGLAIVLWMAGAFAAILLLFELGNFLSFLSILAILGIIGAIIYFFFRFGWLSALLFLGITIVAILVTAFTTQETLDELFQR